MGDFNKKFIIRTAGEVICSKFDKTSFSLSIECHLGASLSEETWDKEVVGIADVDEFIQSENKLILYAFVEENGRKKLKFVEEVDGVEKKIVVFSKVRPIVLSEENILSSLQITSVCGPPTLALYNTLNNVFTPLLTQVGTNQQRSLLICYFMIAHVTVLNVICNFI
jgi:hypothetical protein